MRRRSGRGVGGVAAALLVGIAVGGCEGVGDEQGQDWAAPDTATVTPDGDFASATSQADSPQWLEIDGELVGEHLAYLEGREPAGGFTGAPGWDMEWCMDELGWEVTAHPDGGGVGFGGVADQAVGMDSAMEACTDFLGLRDMDPFTEDFLTLQYDNNLQIADCLRGMGFAVDDPPSREVYVQQTIAKRWTAWNVHEHVPDGQLGTVQRQCPGRPLWELYAESNQ